MKLSEIYKGIYQIKITLMLLFSSQQVGQLFLVSHSSFRFTQLAFKCGCCKHSLYLRWHSRYNFLFICCKKRFTLILEPFLYTIYSHVITPRPCYLPSTRNFQNIQQLWQWADFSLRNKIINLCNTTLNYMRTVNPFKTLLPTK